MDVETVQQRLPLAVHQAKAFLDMELSAVTSEIAHGLNDHQTRANLARLGEGALAHLVLCQLLHRVQNLNVPPESEHLPGV